MDSCPRIKTPPEAAKVDPTRKKKKQKKKKTSSQKLPSLAGSLEVDIGLDTLDVNSPPKEKDQDKGDVLPGSSSSAKSETSEKAGRVLPTRSSSSSSEDSASTEAETSEYYSEEDSTSK